jgi:hypothetical protein
MLSNITLSDLGSWASIISLLATGILAIFTRSIKGKVQRMYKFKNFKADKKSLMNDLISAREVLVIEESNELANISELSETLRRLSDYSLYMKFSDKVALWRANRIISKGINRKNQKKLLNCISTLVGFLKTRMEIDINNI